MKKYEIETKVTRKYEVHFRAPDDKTAHLVVGKINEYLHENRDMAEVIGQDFATEGVRELTVSNPTFSSNVREPVSMQQEDIEIRNEVEWWNGNLNSFEIYDKLKDEFSEPEQIKLINYAKEYFHNCKDLQYQLQDMADTLGIDLDDE